MKTSSSWRPPTEMSRDEVVARSRAVLAMPDRAIAETEDVFRIRALELDWDIAVALYEPKEAGAIARGADGKKIGVFVLHGGSGDFKSMEVVSRAFAGKFGCKVMSMTFPGRFWFDDPSHDWPGDTMNADGTMRMPVWKRGEKIGPEQYDVVRDTSMRQRYGTRTVARAKPGTPFYDRMAAWPIAFEEAMKDAMRRHFPEGEFSIYVTGHSTGGPITNMISQRVPNIAGIVAIESSPYGFIQEKQHAWSGALGKIAGFERVTKTPKPRTDPFNELYIRTWRDRARYAGPEALGQEGPQALMRLPWLMEEIFDWWDKTKARPQFKAEYIITHNITASLEAAARAAARRLKMSVAEEAALVDHYLGLPFPLKGPGVKPTPPVLAIITKDSRDHSPEVYEEVVKPLYAGIAPAPKFEVCRLGAGVHTYHKPEPDLPQGVAPTAAQIHFEAITNGWFLT